MSDEYKQVRGTRFDRIGQSFLAGEFIPRLECKYFELEAKS